MYSLLNGLIGASFTICGMTGIIIMCFFKDMDLLIYIHLIMCAAVGYLMSNYLTETPVFLLDQKNYKGLNEVITKISIINETYYEQRVKHRIEALEEFHQFTSKRNEREDGQFG